MKLMRKALTMPLKKVPKASMTESASLADKAVKSSAVKFKISNLKLSNYYSQTTFQLLSEKNLRINLLMSSLRPLIKLARRSILQIV